jgi:hypothetical protein
MLRRFCSQGNLNGNIPVIVSLAVFFLSNDGTQQPQSSRLE